MIRSLALLLLPLAVAACDGRPLPVASGPVRQLNVGRWTPGPNDLTAPPEPARPAAARAPAPSAVSSAAAFSATSGNLPPGGGA